MVIPWLAKSSTIKERRRVARGRIGGLRRVAPDSKKGAHDGLSQVKQAVKNRRRPSREEKEIEAV